MPKLTVASMFAGIGGICSGFRQNDYEILWANEINPNACKTYRHNFGGSYLVESDIRVIDPFSVPDIDVLTAGFPCQSFSLGGAQRGFDDQRGILFFEVAKVIDAKRPKVIFLENVQNLIEHDSGKTFQVIYSTLVQFGYFIRYKVMPSNKFGNVPQPRKRIYIVAFRDLSVCNRFSFPEELPLTQNIFNIVNKHEQKPEIYYYVKGDTLFNAVVSSVTDSNYIYRIFNGKITKLRNGLSPTLTASMCSVNNAAVVKDDFGIRRLTLRECLDIQAFPKEYYFPNSISLSDAYKQIGNSVTVSVIRRVAKCIRAAI